MKDGIVIHLTKGLQGDLHKLMLGGDGEIWEKKKSNLLKK